MLKDLFSTYDRTKRLDYFLTALIAVTLEVFAVLAVWSLPHTTIESQFALRAVVAMPFAWIMACYDIRRLQDLGWAWLLDLPLLPVYFWSLWPLVFPSPSAIASTILVSLVLYAVVLGLFLILKRGMPGSNRFGTDPLAAVPAAYSPVRPRQAPRTITCPNGHNYPADGSSTCPFCALPEVETAKRFNPVVGWLVAVEGPVRGQDFPLFPERNRIGSQAGMDVVVNDLAIQGRNHAEVIYDPLNNAYSLAGGGPQRDVYLNGPPLEKVSALAAYDQVRLGKTTLVFVPLCGPDYKWDLESRQLIGLARQL